MPSSHTIGLAEFCIGFSQLILYGGKVEQVARERGDVSNPNNCSRKTDWLPNALNGGGAK